jgi:hypothetical protein
MDRRRFVKSAGWGTAGLLLNSAAAISQEEPARPEAPAIAQTAWGRVFVRWTEAALPSAKALGVNDLVIPWGASRALVESGRRQGYRVYAAATLKEASAVADAGPAMGISGIILEAGDSGPKAAAEAASHLRLDHPHLAFLTPGSNGKQPSMKGSTVIKHGSILEVSSPTAQPWIDSNLATVAFERATSPTEIPLIAFPWELSDALQQQQGPSTEDYSLAVAEAGALHCDLILSLHPKLQKALAGDGAGAWAAWKQVASYIDFCRKRDQRPVALSANVGVVTDNYEASYETTNLMARHNIAFRVLAASDLAAQGLNGLDLVVVFAQPGEAAAKEVAEFAAGGGVAILAGLHGHFPWQSDSAGQTSGKSVTYTAGKGKIIELSEGIADPGTFAQDVRRLLGKEKVLISLWNASTTLAIVYKLSGSSQVTLELLNYSAESLPVQVRIKGSYPSVRYETPERGCCEILAPVCEDGFTEFVVPWLRIGGRVHLGPAAKH